MKKLRMIVTSVVVLAIVGSAFAFNAKRGANFCVTSNLSSTTCNAFQNNKEIDASGTEFKYYPNWSGNKAACTATGNTLCTGTIKLITN